MHRLSKFLFLNACDSRKLTLKPSGIPTDGSRRIRAKILRFLRRICMYALKYVVFPPRVWYTFVMADRITRLTNKLRKFAEVFDKPDKTDTIACCLSLGASFSPNDITVRKFLVIFLILKRSSCMFFRFVARKETRKLFCFYRGFL